MSARDEAPRLVGRLFGLVAHALVYGLGCTLLFVVTTPFVTTIVALAWGIALTAHGVFAVAPLVRRPLEAQARRALGEGSPRAPRAGELQALSAAIAHEIRNPITAAKSLVQQIAESPTSPDNAEYATVAVSELDRVERSIVHLLRFAREEPMTIERVPLGALASDAFTTVQDRAGSLGVRVVRELADAADVAGDREQLRRVVESLLVNALDALAQAQTESPRIELAAGRNLAGDEAWLAVRDNGPGVPLQLREKVLAPFFTQKEGGTGFGLALAKKTLEAHGGRIEVAERRGGGAELLVVLPVPPKTQVEARS